MRLQRERVALWPVYVFRCLNYFRLCCLYFNFTDKCFFWNLCFLSGGRVEAGKSVSHYLLKSICRRYVSLHQNDIFLPKQTSATFYSSSYVCQFVCVFVRLCASVCVCALLCAMFEICALHKEAAGRLQCHWGHATDGTYSQGQMSRSSNAKQQLANIVNVRLTRKTYADGLITGVTTKRNVPNTAIISDFKPWRMLKAIRWSKHAQNSKELQQLLISHITYDTTIMSVSYTHLTLPTIYSV